MNSHDALLLTLFLAALGSVTGLAWRSTTLVSRQVAVGGASPRGRTPHRANAGPDANRRSHQVKTKLAGMDVMLRSRTGAPRSDR